MQEARGKQGRRQEAFRAGGNMQEATGNSQESRRQEAIRAEGRQKQQDARARGKNQRDARARGKKAANEASGTRQANKAKLKRARQASKAKYKRSRQARRPSSSEQGTQARQGSRQPKLRDCIDEL
jgi:hypothetical protein